MPAVRAVPTFALAMVAAVSVACAEDGKLPFDHAKDGEALRETDAYRRLNAARFG